MDDINNHRYRDMVRYGLIWERLFKHPELCPPGFFEEELFVGDVLRNLGFEMDCGESFTKAFPEKSLRSDNLDEWREILKKIDLQTLGNTLFSEWRYLTHWDPFGMRENTFEWFSMGFARLAELAIELDHKEAASGNS